MDSNESCSPGRSRYAWYAAFRRSVSALVGVSPLAIGGGSYPKELATKLDADVYAPPDYVNAGLLTVPGRTEMPRLNWRVWSK